MVIYTCNIFFFFCINIYGYNSSNETRALFEMIEAKIVFWLKKKKIYIYIYIYIYILHIHRYISGWYNLYGRRF